MLDVTLDINLDDIIDDVDATFLKQIPYAAYLALNETVFKTTMDVRNRVFPYFILGGPVPFTKRGVRYTKAKSKHELVADVYIPDDQWKYMMWVIDAGRKRWARSQAGIGVPIYENVRFNKYGNIPGRRRKEAIWRRALARQQGDDTVTKGLGRNQFIGTSKNGVTGLWQRTGPNGRGKPKLLIFFTRESVYYRPTVPFAKKAAFYGAKRFRKAFNKRVQQVIERESRRMKVR